MRGGTAVAAALLVLAAGPAWGQPPGPASGRTEAPQVSQVIKGNAATTAPDVPADAPERLAPEQLAPAAPTAEAATPLSTVREGRQVGVQPVHGVDRCDPTRTGAIPPGCDRILERRTAEFTKPGPTPVSPEARLLIIGTPPPPAPSDARTAARDIGAGVVSDQLAAEALAASTNQPPPPTAQNAVPTSGGTVVVPPSR